MARVVNPNTGRVVVGGQGVTVVARSGDQVLVRIRPSFRPGVLQDLVTYPPEWVHADDRCPECNSGAWQHVGTVLDSAGEHYDYDCGTCRHRERLLVKPTPSPREGCTDDHSNGEHCPVHGYDDSVPAPDGFAWHRVQRADGQDYSALVRL